MVQVIIDRMLYDTDQAEEIGAWKFPIDPKKPKGEKATERLLKSRRGIWLLLKPDDVVEKLTAEEAFAWADKAKLPLEVITKHFDELLEKDFEDPEKD